MASPLHVPFRQGNRSVPGVSRGPLGFTLIEVLVVVAIIALLIAILFPALRKARRQGRVVVCSSNIAQLCRGMIAYTHESNGHYAPHLANYPNQVQFQRDMRPFPDYRRLLYERFANKQEDALWCPLISTAYYMQPSRSQANLGDLEDERKWSKVFFVAFTSPSGAGYGGSPSYMSGYAVFAGLTTNPKPKPGEPATYAGFWSWDQSGNRYRDHEPRQAGYSQDAIIADVNEAWPKEGYGTPLRPHRTYHSENWDELIGTADGVNRFVDSNVGFGDGSVQTRRRLRNHVGRDGIGSSATGCYSY
ncbi:MAG: prepilin-type N-terminal cleavage/methylation domain-containing protein [Phycisphaerae bacterium]|nr:prepilin-type N-terminal cleavage/methylation domain-containing protein [Phycisphaerae bacterium]